MFKDLQTGFQVSILDKSGRTPVYRVGTVVGVSQPRFDQRQMQGQMAGQTMYQERLVDLTVECDGHTNTFAVRETANVESKSTLTLACSADAVANEVRAIHKNSTDIIESVDRHKEVVVECEKILRELNPAYAQQQAQSERIDKIEAAVLEMANAMRQMQSAVVAASEKNKQKNKD